MEIIVISRDDEQQLFLIWMKFICILLFKITYVINMNFPS